MTGATLSHRLTAGGEAEIKAWQPVDYKGTKLYT
jgi:hypothetical protein